MQLQEIRAFVSLAETGDPRLAAEQLRISPVDLESLVKTLQRRKGRLLEQTNGRHTLTSEGWKYYYKAIETLANSQVVQEVPLVEENESRVSEPPAPTDTFSIGIIPSVCPYIISALLRDLRRQRPQTELVVYEDYGHNLICLANIGTIQLAVAALPLADVTVEMHPFYREHIWLVVPVNHPLAAADSVPAQELMNHPLILPPIENSLTQEIDLYFRNQQISPRIVGQATQLLSVFHMVSAGHGLALLPDMACRMSPSDLYRCIPLDPAPPLRTLLLFWAVGEELPPAGLWLVNWLSNYHKTLKPL
jgi:DNA-binding transcriptional LysR family regulator